MGGVVSSSSNHPVDNNESGLKCLNYPKPTAQRVYDANGLATTLSANGGGQSGKTGLYLVNGTKDDLVHTIDANYYKGLSPSSVGKGKRTHIVEKR